MKFLVLALCVCAAAAQSYPGFGGFRNPAYAPAVTAAKAVAYAPVTAAKVVAEAAAPVFTPVAAPVAQAAAATYGAAKQVVNKAYNNEAEAAILRSENEVAPDGFKYTYETANGISAESVGTYKQVGEAGSVVAQGAYRYTAPDGTPVFVTYTADENGYQPQSDLLPVAPEIPPQIARALAYIAAHPAPVEKKY
ncbi:larval cuticle protein LCP-17-like [Spodoptera litura]|uniref:Cuticular protein RR-1 n=1 Tax=Spodoptera litura TaxID=69820 RepID=A0A4V6DVG5_SPOLT|nr:larval cuticle protein LCP-17-like [Spodoptera litura]TKX27772.1 cuticular protein RR-1 [Spodoptera litura]